MKIFPAGSSKSTDRRIAERKKVNFHFTGHSVYMCRGDLMVAGNLDYEVSKQHVMFVGVTDGEFTDQARVVIDVLNVNDHNPEFGRAEYFFDVPNDARRSGAVIGLFDGVRDRDGDNVTLSLLNFNELVYTDSSFFPPLLSFPEEFQGKLFFPFFFRFCFSIFQFEFRSFSTFEIDDRTLVVIDADLLNMTQYRLNVMAEDNGVPPRRTFVPAVVQFPPIAMAATVLQSNQYFVLALVLGSLAGFLLLVVLCLVCYLGKT